MTSRQACHVKDAAGSDVELLEVYRHSKILVRLGGDHIDDDLLRETHPESVELVHLGEDLPTMQVELAFGIVDGGHSPGAHSGLF